MMKMTSAYANKMLRKLNEDKDFWSEKEAKSFVYVVAMDEEPVIPEYDYMEVAGKMAEIDGKIAAIKHAINLSNATNQIEIEGEKFTVDTILVKMAQLNRRKGMLDVMRKKQPKTRMEPRTYGARKTVPEYEYINYDLDLIKKEYEAIDNKIALMQLGLDKYNQTVEFEVEI